MVRIKTQNQSQGGPMLTLKEVAQLLGVHYMTAWRLCGAGKIPYYKDGGIVRVPVDALDEYLRSHSKGQVGVVALQEPGGVQ